MDQLARKLINDHRNPIVKVELPGTKLFLKSCTSEEAEFIEKHQNNLGNLLRHQRAERRCARSQATWLPEINLAKVTKVVKGLMNNFGYQDKTGIFLYPEEMLFLMETNRLEVTHREVSLSIQEGYDLFKTCEGTLLKYRAYKKLVLLGYRLLKHSEVLRRQLNKKRDNGSKNKSEGNEISKKRDVDNSDDQKDLKKLCTESREDSPHEQLKIDQNEGSSLKIDQNEGSSSKVYLQDAYFKNIFDNLRKNAPKQYEPSQINNEIPDYCVFLPNNKSRLGYDFNLLICEDAILNKELSDTSVPVIYAICTNDNISFYRFSCVNLPFL